MRTTLTIEPDVAIEIERRRRASGDSLKQVVNRLLRRGVRAETETVALPPYRTPTFDLELRPGIDETRLNQLVDELEIETYLDKEKGAHEP